jgi:hypothetical protein
MVFATEWCGSHDLFRAQWLLFESWRPNFHLNEQFAPNQEPLGSIQVEFIDAIRT